MTAKKDILPHIIRQLESVDGDKLQAIFDALAALLPATAENIRSVNASAIDWDEPAPPEAFPADIYRTTEDGRETLYLQDAGELSKLSSDPLYTGPFELTLNRQYASNAMIEGGKQNVGWLAPCIFLDKFSVIVPDGDNDRIYIVAPAGGPANMTVTKLAEFAVGDTPRHACQTSDGTIYVTCDDGAGNASIWRVRNGSSSLFWDSAGAGAVDGLRKIATNRNGTFLYAICKDSGDSYYDSVLQLNVATAANDGVQNIDKDSSGTPASATSTENEIVDIVVFYPDERSGKTRDAYVAVAQSKGDGETAGNVWIWKGDDGSTGVTGWGSLDISDDAVSAVKNNPTSEANEHIRAMVAVGTSLFILASYTSEADTAWAVWSYDQTEHEATATLAAGFSLIQSGTNTQAWNTTGASDCYGSACATPDGVYAMLPNGDLLYWARGAADIVIFTPRAGWADGTGTSVALGSSVAFIGRCIVAQATNTAADGESIIMRPF